MAGSRFSLSVRHLGVVGAVGRLISYSLVFLSNMLVYPLSKLLPRDSALWVFGAPGGRFEGNSKYLYLWANMHPAKVRCVWITENRALAQTLRARQFSAHYRWSLGGIWSAARARLYFVNDGGSDINFSLSGGACLFNLWHGVGLKNVNKGAAVGYGAQLRAKRLGPIAYIRNMRRFQDPSYILSTSVETAEKFFARCFGLPPHLAPALGYPRLDPIFDENLKRLALTFEDYSVLDQFAAKYSRLILYVPTLRVVDENLLAEAIPDTERLSQALVSQDAGLVLKLHPKTQVQKGWIDCLPGNILLLSEEQDIYPVLDRFHALITDYSSLFFDYIFFRSAGVVMYPFDFDRYIKNDRDLAWDYKDVTIGNRADDFNALCKIIGSGAVFDELDKLKLSALRRQFWDGDPKGRLASQRILIFANQIDLDLPPVAHQSYDEVEV